MLTNITNIITVTITSGDDSKIYKCGYLNIDGNRLILKYMVNTKTINSFKCSILTDETKTLILLGNYTITYETCLLNKNDYIFNMNCINDYYKKPLLDMQDQLDSSIKWLTVDYNTAIKRINTYFYIFKGYNIISKMLASIKMGHDQAYHFKEALKKYKTIESFIGSIDDWVEAGIKSKRHEYNKFKNNVTDVINRVKSYNDKILNSKEV